MNRKESLNVIKNRREPFDFIIIGGGATGLGIAVDASSRGYSVALFEQVDFAKGTSSRSTKLIHGGVRYLQKGQIALLKESLKERHILHENAPHLVQSIAFIVPSYSRLASPFYWIGLKIYDLLARKYNFKNSSYISKNDVIKALPTIKQDGLVGGIRYFDGQFDDARLALNLAQTANEHGAHLINYAAITGFEKNENSKITAVIFTDHETGESYSVSGRLIINATGPFVDNIRALDSGEVKSLISPSQGIHLVFDKKLLPSDNALIIPHTDDGRVLFAIPWHDVVVVGTTDTPITSTSLEPKAFDQEINFVLTTLNRYLSKQVSRENILSVFTGIRPLVRKTGIVKTANLSRDHAISVEEKSGLVTITGGKWTTYRRMAEELVNKVIPLANLKPQACKTKKLKIHGAETEINIPKRLSFYGSDAVHILELEKSDTELEKQIHPDLPITAAQVVWAVHHEMALTVEDVLSRRTRALLLNSKASYEMAREVALIMAKELHRSEAWVEQQTLAYKNLTETFYQA